MRKLLVLTVLGIVAAFGFNASAASAASCATAYYGPIYWDGQFAYSATISGCSGVNGAEFSGQGYPNAAQTGIYNCTCTPYGGYHITPYAGVTIFNIKNSYQVGYHVPFFGGGCGAAPMYGTPHAFYRIRNSFGNTWGPWHAIADSYQYYC